MVELNFANTNLEVLNAVRDFIGAGKIYRHFSSTSRCYQLSICDHRDALRVAEAILPYAIIKRTKLKDLIEFIRGKEWRPSGRKGLLKNVGREDLFNLYWREGKSLEEVGRILNGVGPYAIAYHLRKLGIPVRPRGHIETLKQFTSRPRRTLAAPPTVDS